MNLRKFNWQITILSIIVLIAGFNIFFNLGEKHLHQDENAHFLTAYGFKQTGDFVKWDFLNERALEPYTRNFIYTYVVYVSNSLFGWNEFSTRLPGAIIGVLGVFLIYFITILITRKQAIALGASYLYSVNDVVLYFARFARGYIFLMLIAIVLFYLSYLIAKSTNVKDLIKLTGLSALFFILGLHFHPTIVLLLPGALIAMSIFFFRNYSVKKYHLIYLLILLGFILILLNILGRIEIVPYLNFEEHISLEFELTNYDFIYLKHLTNPYNIPYYVLFILPFILIFTWRKNKELSYVLGSFVFIPLAISAYMFNRYEDFRYIAIIQPIFIILVSSSIYYLIDFLKLKKTWKFLLFGLIILLIIPFQFPGVHGSNFLVQESQATSDNIELGRIHRRAATPELEKTYEWIFNQPSDRVTIIKPSDGGINWDDNYYLWKYLERYPNKKLILYQETAYYSGKFNEVYHHSKYYTNLDKNVPFESIIHQNDTYIVANVRHLMNQDLLYELDNNCINLADQIEIVKFNYFEEYSKEENNYFPNVFTC
jgi:hypothetical protein